MHNYPKPTDNYHRLCACCAKYESTLFKEQLVNALNKVGKLFEKENVTKRVIEKSQTTIVD